MIVERLDAPAAAHGEGPVWDARDGVIRWVDMVAGEVHHLDPRTPGSHGVVRVGSWAAVIRPRVDGGWVIADRSGFLLADPAFSIERRIAVFDDQDLRMNDGGCTPDGALLCGTAGPDGTGRLYRLAREGAVTVLIDGVSVSNGIGVDPRGDVLYVDSATRRIDRLRISDGVLAERAPFADLRSEEGVPDGIAVDVEGGVWVAMWGAGRVVRVDPDGTVGARIPVPTPHVSACAFGGDGLAELFITTSQQDLRPPDADAGRLFVARPGVAGSQPLPFRG